MKKNTKKIQVINQGNRWIEPLQQSKGIEESLLEKSIEYGTLEDTRFQPIFGSCSINYEIQQMPYLNDVDIRIFDMYCGYTFDVLKIKLFSSTEQFTIRLRSEINKCVQHIGNDLQDEVESLDDDVCEMCLGKQSFDLEKLIKQKIDINKIYKKIDYNEKSYNTFLVNAFVLEIIENGNIIEYFSEGEFKNITTVSKVFDINNIIEEITEKFLKCNNIV